MRNSFVTAAIILALGSSAYASTITPRQAAANQGQNVIVEGKANIHTDPSQSGLDVDLIGDDSSHVLGFVPEGSENAIPNIKSYDGKTVDLAGVVTIDQGQPEIRITSARQLGLASTQ